MTACGSRVVGHVDTSVVLSHVAVVVVTCTCFTWANRVHLARFHMQKL